MAKNRNKKQRNGAASMDISEPSDSDVPYAMDTSESRVELRTQFLVPTLDRKLKKGRPMKTSQNVGKMKAIAKTIFTNDRSVGKVFKKIRIQSAKKAL